ncbi:LOB domain-containing protein 16-like [Prosopis cineraria]|uniref:LOB domain-containing protein 16-like n=1 Tax=Prosopis cineraria TaxID=364024 RepID=UPI0024106035|nr:LOB domain-containing protein 16-like [Prosopis cineraria]XP_054800693.1 LOB domain-containing protein 16-like [Prosopis cineraria]
MACSGSNSGNGSGGSGSPCGACKFLRRKCAADCIFAPYFCSEQGPASFAAIHKVFGASNVSKLLLNLPPHDRCEAVLTIAYEAQARIRDPVYGCVSHIFALQQQVACLQAQLMQAKAQLAEKSMANEECWGRNGYGQAMNPIYGTSYTNMNPISPQSSLDSIDYSSIHDGSMNLQQEDFSLLQPRSNKKSSSYDSNDLSELQELALRMMRN